MAANLHGPFFRRHVPPDLAGLRADMARQRGLIAAARTVGDGAAELEAMTMPGHELFMAGEETEAAPLLDAALALSRAANDARAEIVVLLGLATARQYLGERALAQRLFDEALTLCAASGIREQEHFLLHHRGRCYVEQGMMAEARTAFTQALELRKAIGNPRFIDATQAALDDMAKL